MESLRLSHCAVITNPASKPRRVHNGSMVSDGRVNRPRRAAKSYINESATLAGKGVFSFSETPKQ